MNADTFTPPNFFETSSSVYPEVMTIRTPGSEEGDTPPGIEFDEDGMALRFEYFLRHHCDVFLVVEGEHLPRQFRRALHGLEGLLKISHRGMVLGQMRLSKRHIAHHRPEQIAMWSGQWPTIARRAASLI